MQLQESGFYLAFSNSPQVGPKRLTQLLHYFGSAEKAWSGAENDFLAAGFTTAFYGKLAQFRRTFSIDEYKERLSNQEVRFVARADSEYPEKLLDLEDPPIGLYVKGDAGLLKELGVAIVGSRKMTSYGRDVTEKFASELAANGLVIFSGLALGVDSIAHIGALSAHGKTVAVLGCGVDCCYPQKNSVIYRNILSGNGLIVSEYPLSRQPTKGSFPARNRIIAALSEAVLVPEAGVDSGSLITAGIAQKLGRKVFAVPGPITSKVSLGTAMLLKEGAVVVASSEDVLSYLGSTMKQLQTKDIQESVDDPQMKKILALLSVEPLTIDVLAKSSLIPIHQLTSLISELEMLGFISSSPAGSFSVRQSR